jgi:NAD(P)-dependent dehydrogenase (short-subunit alcohol dehydrogenase family)
VAFIDIDAAAAERLIGELAGGGVEAPIFRSFDLSDLAGIKTVVNELGDAVGGISVLVNNAANDTRHAPEELTPQRWQELLSINIGQQFFCAQVAADQMKRQGAGSVINFGSVCYSMALPGLSAYSAAKAAVIGLTRSLAREWGGDNIRVNTLIPGCIMTEKQLNLWVTPEGERAIQERQCIKRRLLGDDVAQMAMFLASEVSSACTAQAFTVDGGIV